MGKQNFVYARLESEGFSARGDFQTWIKIAQWHISIAQLTCNTSKYAILLLRLVRTNFAIAWIDARIT